jgi:hypothetical protein
VIDLFSEELIEVIDLPAKLPRRKNGKPYHLSAVYRWMKVGLSGVKLETVFYGGIRYTSKEAVSRFWNQVTLARKNQQGRGFINE